MNDHLSTSVRLAREWATISRRPRLVSRANTWEVTDRPITSLDELVRAVGGGGDCSSEADQRLRRLVTVARHDDLAGRVVVERLTPGLLAIARRQARQDPRAFEELLAAAWIAIRTYNPQRRPASVAAALLSDTEYSAYRRWRRHRGASEVPVEFLEHGAAEPEPDPRDELADLVEHARAAGMCRTDLDLVMRLATTPRTEDVALQLSVTARTVRNRRDRVTAALREIARAA